MVWIFREKIGIVLPGKITERICQVLQRILLGRGFQAVQFPAVLEFVKECGVLFRMGNVAVLDPFQIEFLRCCPDRIF